MRRLTCATLLTAALVAPLSPALTTTAHAGTGHGWCTPTRLAGHMATGSWDSRGVTLSGRTEVRRLSRDSRTTIAVLGVGTYRNVGPAQWHRAPRRLTMAPLALVTVTVGGMFKHTCSFRLAKR